MHARPPVAFSDVDAAGERHCCAGRLRQRCSQDFSGWSTRGSRAASDAARELSNLGGYFLTAGVLDGDLAIDVVGTMM